MRMTLLAADAPSRTEAYHMPAAEVAHALRGHVGEELLLQGSHRRQRARCQHYSMCGRQHLRGSKSNVTHYARSLSQHPL